MCKSVPHKHAEVIKAWADGATIQLRDHHHGNWRDWGYPWSPGFDPHQEYRVKPKKKTAGQVYWEAAHRDFTCSEPAAHVERGAKAVIEAYKRREIEE